MVKLKIYSSKSISLSKNIFIFIAVGDIKIRKKCTNEFKHFIGEKMRLDPVILGKEVTIQDLLKYYMGKNTKERQDFIIENLRVEEDIIDA